MFGTFFVVDVVVARWRLNKFRVSNAFFIFFSFFALFCLFFGLPLSLVFCASIPGWAQRCCCSVFRWQCISFYGSLFALFIVPHQVHRKREKTTRKSTQRQMRWHSFHAAIDNDYRYDDDNMSIAKWQPQAFRNRVCCCCSCCCWWRRCCCCFIFVHHQVDAWRKLKNNSI